MYTVPKRHAHSPVNIHESNRSVQAICFECVPRSRQRAGVAGAPLMLQPAAELGCRLAGPLKCSRILTESSGGSAARGGAGRGRVHTQHFTQSAARRARPRVHASRNMAVLEPACSYRPRAGRAPPSDCRGSRARAPPAARASTPPPQAAERPSLSRQLCTLLGKSRVRTRF